MFTVFTAEFPTDTALAVLPIRFSWLFTTGPDVVKLKPLPVTVAKLSEFSFSWRLYIEALGWSPPEDNDETSLLAKFPIAIALIAALTSVYVSEQGRLVKRLGA